MKKERLFCAAFFLLAFLIFGCGGGGEKEQQPCRISSECPENLICRSGVCVPECKEDRDCQPGYVCSQNKCRPGSSVCIDGSTRVCGSGIGECKQGIQRCINGAWGECEGAVLPKEEICDGLDNDCDGETDEGVKNRCGGCGPEPQEICDGIDNNCDGSTDEGCICVHGTTQECGSDIGECKKGTQICDHGVWGPCLGQIGPSPEVCDGKDNDCDGETDEDFFIGAPCQAPGVCGTGKIECATLTTTRCSSEPGGSEDKSSPEICDGLDNDCDGETDEGVKNRCGGCGPEPQEICDGIDNNCDGATDEGCACIHGTVQSCGSDIGECKKGFQICDHGVWGPCLGQIGPSPEVCDGKDNDCDGEVDENLDCPLSIRWTPPTLTSSSFTMFGCFGSHIETDPKNCPNQDCGADGLLICVGEWSALCSVSQQEELVCPVLIPSGYYLEFNIYRDDGLWACHGNSTVEGQLKVEYKGVLADPDIVDNRAQSCNLRIQKKP